MRRRTLLRDLYDWPRRAVSFFEFRNADLLRLRAHAQGSQDPSMVGYWQQTFLLEIDKHILERNSSAEKLSKV